MAVMLLRSSTHYNPGDDLSLSNGSWRFAASLLLTAQARLEIPIFGKKFPKRNTTNLVIFDQIQ
jgi:hypothetical protein